MEALKVTSVVEIEVIQYAPLGTVDWIYKLNKAKVKLLIEVRGGEGETMKT